VAESNKEQLQTMRHSMAHIMAAAVQKLWPEAKFGVGPSIDDGFYYDIDLGDQVISEEDFKKIQKEIQAIIKADYPFEKQELDIEGAIKWAKESNQPYKSELLNDLKTSGTTNLKEIESTVLGISDAKEVVKTVTLYTTGQFTDLCRGPHLESTAKAGVFKIMKVAGAYWRGKETNPQMQRLYGVAFETKEELAKHLLMLEEAKKRDHRKLGPELELFYFHDTAPGMPYWLPKGVKIYNELINFWREEHQKRNYQEIVSPLLNKKELYIISGHYEHYWEEMFTCETPEGELYAMKAMNCPNAMLVFKMKNRSYRDLPLRLSDTDTLHRNEMSGALNGLLRVREFRQDDAHIYVSADQIKDEYQRIFEITKLFYSIFGMEYSFRLGTRPEKYMGEPELWDTAEATLREILEESDKDYFVEEGDGAFYGPKIDILMTDALGRPWQMGTIQLDFQQPLRFELKYTDNDGIEKTPIVIHRVIYGSMERFIGILIEHLEGKFPVWLAPEQIRFATVNQTKEIVEYADKVAEQATELGLRVLVDSTNESVGKKIRNAEKMKIPYVIVMGEKELKTQETIPRIRSDMQVQAPTLIKMDNFLKTVANEAKSRVTHTSM